MLLALDIGNSNICAGLFNELGVIEFKTAIKTDKTTTQEEYIEIFQKRFVNYKVTECIISSVCDEVTQKISNTVSELYQVKSIILSADMYFGLDIKTDNPQKVGMDRIANSVAAKNMYSYPAIIVDIGTATTFDIVDKNGDFIGGIIFPGISTQLKSLAQNTSKLPSLNADNFISQTTININTEDEILSGVIKGHAYAIEGLLRDCEQELEEKPIVIGTGGGVKIVSKYMHNKPFDYINTNLTLEGLNLLNNKISAIQAI